MATQRLVSGIEPPYPWDDLGVVLDSKLREIDVNRLPRYLGLFFGAGWSSTCRDFALKLEHMTLPFRNEIAIVCISSDNDPEQQSTLLASTTFHRLPFDRPSDLIARHSVAKRELGLAHIPALVVVDRIDRKTVTSAGIAALNLNGSKAVQEWDLLGMDAQSLRLRLTAGTAPSTPAPTPATPAASSDVSHLESIETTVIPQEEATAKPASEERIEQLVTVPLNPNETAWSLANAFAAETGQSEAAVNVAAPAAEPTGYLFEATPVVVKSADEAPLPTYSSAGESDEDRPSVEASDHAGVDLSTSILMNVPFPSTTSPNADLDIPFAPLTIPPSSTDQAAAAELPTPTPPLVPSDIPLPQLFHGGSTGGMRVPTPYGLGGADGMGGLVSLPVSRRSSIAGGETSDSDGETRLEDSIVVLGKKELSNSAILFKANQ
ncbi:hypothetical protein HDU96_006591 [Phlyctochytrium bullatum]|nr:hypothetical protein HDU96_006591 [Phlyctochytrium bullatum]